MSIGETLTREEKTSLTSGIEGVPDYKVVEFGNRKHDYAVVVFVINEGARVQNQLQAMRTHSRILDIIVADGGSTDGSLESDFLRSTECFALLTKIGAGKLSAQMRMAFHYAIEKGYKGIITIDGNGKDGIEALPRFLELLEGGYDHIQGSRFIAGGYHENTPMSRMIGLKLLHAPLISWASKTKQTDTTNGFRGYSARLLSDDGVDVFREVFQTYELHYHLAIESGRRDDIRNVETPVSRIYPKHGKTPTKISPVKGSLLVLGILVKAVFGTYRSEKLKVERA
jgi:dolichol-phosphate mannosyltransferase